MDDDGKPIIIAPSEVMGYLRDPEFRWYLNLWNVSALVNAPVFGGGWAEWPADIADAWIAFASEQDRLRSEREQANNPKREFTTPGQKPKKGRDRG